MIENRAEYTNRIAPQPANFRELKRNSTPRYHGDTLRVHVGGRKLQVRRFIFWSKYVLLYNLLLYNLLLYNLLLYNLPLYNLPLYNLPLYNLPLYNLPLYNLPLYNLPLYNLPLYNVPLYNVSLYNVPLYNVPLYNVPLYNVLLYAFDSIALSCFLPIIQLKPRICVANTFADKLARGGQFAPLEYLAS